MFVRRIVGLLFKVLTTMFLAIITVVLFAVTLVLWLLNIIAYVFYDSATVWEPVSPWRWILALGLPLLIIRWGLRRKSLSPSGAQAAFVVGFIMTLSSYGFMASMIAFFVAGSKVTKWRSTIKRKMDADFKEGGQRDWLQVICNGGVATEMALVHMINIGCIEYLIDFKQRYTSSWLAVATVASLACSCGDTFSSEVGTVVGNWSPRLITTLQRVPKGTNGAVSIVGSLASMCGGLIIGITYFVVMALVSREDESAPPQWPIIAVATFAGIYGSVIDSVLGATLQYSGLDTETGCIVDRPAESVKHISGVALLDNHGVNLLSSLITSLTVPYIAFNIWGYYA